ncbi:MAG: HAD hydrolase-like protein [Peptococcaceae bacterium]|jgi:phosphoglycolate phosphatase|nr:HAD hydrolase-like protein [Peptococcaceae bacterium]
MMTTETTILPAVFEGGGKIGCDIVIFDLDGTLVDSGPGIKGSVRRAVAELSLPTLSEKELDAFIGPPMGQSFRQRLGLTPSLAAKALRLYRANYCRRGIYDAIVYDGIPELLADLRAKGYRLALGTSKPWVLAHRVLRHFGLRAYFDSVFGSYQNGRLDNKAAVLGELLAHYAGARPLGPGRLAFAAQPPGKPGEARALMIGDRLYDVEGAKERGLPTAGVAYGYGGRAELLGAGAILVVDHPSELSVLLPAKM